MIVTKKITVNKKEFILTKSDTYKIKNELEEIFESAFDSVDAKHVYTETNELSASKLAELKAAKRKKSAGEA